MTASATTIAARLESAVGASHVLTQPADCAPYTVDGVVPTAVVRPTSAEEAAEIVRFAASEKLTVIPCGARTKLAIGMPPARYDVALDMTGLHQIAHYDPGDLTLSVDAGMPLATLNATLNEHNQFLPLFVPYYLQCTVGGTIASGVDSPLRHFYGTARDYIIGAEFVTGSGAPAKSGGRVVKNVTGYDLQKLLIGSLGTLAVITRVNFRTFPAPPASRGFVAACPDLEIALRLRNAITASPLTPLTLEIVNPATATLLASRAPQSIQPPLAPTGDWFHPQHWQLLAAFGGEPAVLVRYERDLTRLAKEASAADIAVLDDSTRPLLWGRLREALPLFLESSPAATILKLGLLPSQLPEAYASLENSARAVGIPLALVARAVGTLYAALLPGSANDEALRNLARITQDSFSLAGRLGGSVMLLFAPAPLKAQVNVWGSPRADFPLMQRVKSSFDPVGVLAPGRFLGGL